MFKLEKKNLVMTHAFPNQAVWYLSAAEDKKKFGCLCLSVHQRLKQIELFTLPVRLKAAIS